MTVPQALLGGLSAAAFMRRHWQKKPLLVRQAWPGVQPPVSRQALFALAGNGDVESRLVRRQAAGGWAMRKGPLPRRGLPPVGQPGWTVLVQGVDLHVPLAHTMLSHFRFVPDARLDDLMLSWASPGGGVGPHVDDYDVFLLQVQGRRRWRVGGAVSAGTAAFLPDAPLRILRRFEAVHDWLLEPGDMLYLPPRWAHDGLADGECMTASVGFRAPRAQALAAELLQRLGDGDNGSGADPLYSDGNQPATSEAAGIPASLQQFAQAAVARALATPGAVDRALGEVLSEPKPRVWFSARTGSAGAAGGVVLDCATRMLHDARCVYINGESYHAGGRDAALMRRLADARALTAAEVARLTVPARHLLDGWHCSGWLHGGPDK